RLFHPTPSGWTSLRDSRTGGCTPGYSIPPLRGGPHFAIPVPGVAPPAIPSHPFGVDLTSRFPYRGLPPRLFHPTPSGWTSLRDSRTGGFAPPAIPSHPFGVDLTSRFPYRGFAPPAIPSHPFGVDLTSRSPSPGVAPPAIPSQPFGVDLTSRSPSPGLCAPGYSIPALRGGPHFAIPVPGVVRPRLFHPPPSGWTSLRDSRPGGCTPGYFIPPVWGGCHSIRKLYPLSPAWTNPSRSKSRSEGLKLST